MNELMILYIILIFNESIHIINLFKNSESKNSENNNTLMLSAIRCMEQVYQKAIMEKYYPNIDIVILMYNLYNYTTSFQSLCYLLEYVNRHNSKLVLNIEEPIFENNSENMLLANHSLKQLNIIQDENFKGKYSSVLNMLNNCSTNMGKRLFKDRLLHPSTNINEINKSYNLIQYFIDNKLAESIKTNLNSIRILINLKGISFITR